MYLAHIQLLTETEKTTLPSTDALASSLKRSCSITFSSNPKRSSYAILSVTPSLECNNQINFRQFSLRLPEWGGFIDLNEEDFEQNNLINCQLFEKIKIIKTCSIDYFLLGLR